MTKVKVGNVVISSDEEFDEVKKKPIELIEEVFFKYQSSEVPEDLAQELSDLTQAQIDYSKERMIELVETEPEKFLRFKNEV